MITAQWTPHCDADLPFNPFDRDQCPGWLDIGGSEGDTRKGATQAAKRAGWTFGAGGRIYCPRCARRIGLVNLAKEAP